MQPLLGPDDPPPFSVHNLKGEAPLLLLCDHAAKAVPRSLGTLGVPEGELSRHIGWDIGGLEAAQELSTLLDAPLVASGYSRLVIDCNRWPGGEGSTPEVSDGTPVPGNRGLTKEQIDTRAQACFWPYHHEVDRQLDRMTVGGRKVCLLVVHSFTPEMKGFKRPWHVGVLWTDDPRLPHPLLAELRRDPTLVVGDNEPYSARASYEYTLTAHARPRALPHCSLEVRQDLMATPEAARSWGRRLAPAIRTAVAAALA
ncbi:Predicted N-formylglutamate amidohydrolase [Enhydrobacter aerosaccus]|uniref:Predicted N-formylglutamate amidohydrolase n=1 Tax=Enhydrobacter aerosaccus TaxID=225324 RepID=A0A1T4T9K3_9HYPH|nr:N-formylglutamate amidohydrolase [Enhydrobacter aerosaccus]SKA36828.1 Predicted N-formylglutamate amidohydrolase [Enhydrobacter aerosaccus]